jgi:MYXO-CTERM domain-containing protein
VCDGTSNTCVACNGDHGSGARDACPTPGNPYCESTGACGQCTSSTQCTTGTHDGPFCNTTTGACGAGPDAGAPDAGSDGGAADGSAGGDGGPTDAAADATSPEDSGLTDASSPPEDSGSDAAVAADATASGGSIAGGGCSCDAVGASRDGPSRAGGFAALVGLGFFASRRRRKSGGG